MEWELYNWCGWEAQDSEPDNAWWCGYQEGDAEDWWYYCEWDEDGSIWYCTDDFGQDESFENTTGNNFRENSSVSGYMDYFMLNATSDFESYQISASLPDSCLNVMEIEIEDENAEDGDLLGLFVALFYGSGSYADDNENDIPDCLEFGGPNQDGLPPMGSQHGTLDMGFENPDWGFMQEVIPFAYMEANIAYNMTIIGWELSDDEEYVLSTRTTSFGELLMETNETVTTEDGMFMYNFTMEFSEWDCLIDTEVVLHDQYGEERIDEYRMLMTGPCPVSYTHLRANET